MRITHYFLASLLCLSAGLLPMACKAQVSSSAQTPTLTTARHGFKTVLQPEKGSRDPVEKAPPKLFLTGTYPAPGGKYAAYLTPDPGDRKKHPAILWITGGDCNSIGDVWTPSSPSNDQTAAAYRKAGIVMMFPSLRGGNTNAGTKEGFLGEVDDVLAAARFLATLPYVDPTRIYLGGHSTGGTLSLLVAESPNPFRAIFSFGPVAVVSGYGKDSGFLPFDIANRNEVVVRSPGYWLASVRAPVWVIEGTGQGNIASVRAMEKISTNPQVHFLEVDGATHFSVLAPLNAKLAQSILADTAGRSAFTFSAAPPPPANGVR